MKKWLDKKSIFNFRVYGVTEWTMGDCAHIAQCLGGWGQPDGVVWLGQPDNFVWSVDRA